MKAAHVWISFHACSLLPKFSFFSNKNKIISGLKNISTIFVFKDQQATESLQERVDVLIMRMNNLLLWIIISLF